MVHNYCPCRVSVFVLQKEATSDQSLALSSDPTSTRFSLNDDDVSSLHHRSAVRKVRDSSGMPDASNQQDLRLNDFDHQSVGQRRSTHTRRYARDLSYYDDDDDEEQRLRDILERLEGQQARLSKRQPIDRIDEPSEWRDRLRIMRPRHSLDRFPLPVFFEGRNKRQPLDDRIICWVYA